MAGLVPFFIILFAGLVLSEIFQRLNLPYVSALIIAGIILGPDALGIVETDDTLRFLAEVGVVFLMFSAGTETRFGNRNDSSKVLTVAILNGLIPFICGLSIGIIFNLGAVPSLILGISFISSSIAVVIPTLESFGISQTKIGNLIVSSTVLEDIFALVLLSIILRQESGDTNIPLPIYIVIIIGVTFSLKYVIKWIESLYHSAVKINNLNDLFERELRFTVVILLASAILFELLGLEAIIAGFIIGVLLKDYVKQGKVGEKIRTLGYGIFIPAFFIVIGMEVDLDSISSDDSVLLIICIIFGLIVSKFISGLIAGEIIKLKRSESLLIGIATTPQLTTTLATVYAASESGIVPEDLVAAMVLLALVTSILSPIGVSKLAQNIETKKKREQNKKIIEKHSRTEAPIPETFVAEEVSKIQ